MLDYMIQRTVVRRNSYQKSSVSQHHGVPIEGPLTPIEPSQHYNIEGFRGALNWSYIVPRDAILSENKSGLREQS